ncbi:hypothetical protein DHD05_20180 [Arenibacter sp. N53]|uniref:hypothetical protein n=1 Tax=Arenibacter TaxID=178469 RepID=UPI000CD4688C|nr:MULTISPECIES: hypothetical protein [Arenibacter]MCM4153914.1 hypothetical protein [Arenibacter sp. N53]
MKFAILTLFLTVALNAAAQSENVHGSYEIKYETTDGGELKYTLSLNPEGTFLFHSYKKDTRALPPEKNRYGRGKWTMDKNIVSLMTNTTDVVDSLSLDLNNTKARFDSKSPRDLTNRDIKTKLTIYGSDILWLKGIEIFKRD